MTSALLLIKVMEALWLWGWWAGNDLKVEIVLENAVLYLEAAGHQGCVLYEELPCFAGFPESLDSCIPAYCVYSSHRDQVGPCYPVTRSSDVSLPFQRSPGD